MKRTQPQQPQAAAQENPPVPADIAAEAVDAGLTERPTESMTTNVAPNGFSVLADRIVTMIRQGRRLATHRILADEIAAIAKTTIRKDARAAAWDWVREANRLDSQRFADCTPLGLAWEFVRRANAMAEADKQHRADQAYMLPQPAAATVAAGA